MLIIVREPLVERYAAQLRAAMRSANLTTSDGPGLRPALVPRHTSIDGWGAAT